MTGKYDIEVYNNRVHYFLTIKRNITILQGNSATGKTELIRLISEYAANGASSGITLKCDVRCSVLTPEDWEQHLADMSGRIIFIDETASFLRSKRFAELVRGADAYFVIITRDDLKELPYSIDEIYGLRNVSDSQKYKSYKKVYNELYRLYHLTMNEKVIPELVITEDSGSGFECFNGIYPHKCISSGGKSRVFECLRQNAADNILLIVDGAAFGCEMAKIMRYLAVSGRKCVLYAPESFEWLILSSGILTVPKDVLEKTYNYADSREYMSWEDFYTGYLTQLTRSTVYEYSKSNLKDFYKMKGSVRKIIQALPEQIRPDRF